MREGDFPLAGTPPNEPNHGTLLPMPFRLRPCLALLAVASLAWALAPSWGFFPFLQDSANFTYRIVAAAGLAWLLALAACTFPDWHWPASPALASFLLHDAGLVLAVRSAWRFTSLDTEDGWVPMLVG